MARKTVVVTYDADVGAQKEVVTSDRLNKFMRDFSHLVVQKSKIGKTAMVDIAIEKGLLDGDLLLFFAANGIDAMAEDLVKMVMQNTPVEELIKMMEEGKDLLNDIREAGEYDGK